MAGDKRILIELLLETSATRQPSSALGHVSERIRAALLINSSSSPEACLQADAIEYQASDGWQGLGIRDAGRSISDMFEHISRISHIPNGLAKAEPDLSVPELQAAMLLVSKILKAFEYRE
jgi:hypothetical protein